MCTVITKMLLVFEKIVPDLSRGWKSFKKSKANVTVLLGIRSQQPYRPRQIAGRVRGIPCAWHLFLRVGRLFLSSLGTWREGSRPSQGWVFPTWGMAWFLVLRQEGKFVKYFHVARCLNMGILIVYEKNPNCWLICINSLFLSYRRVAFNWGSI